MRLLSTHSNLRSWCKILLTDVSDIPKATACLRAERLGDCKIDALTTLMFSGVRALRGRPGGFLFNVEPVCLNLAAHRRIVFRVGTSPLEGMRKCVRKARCVAMTDSLFLKKASTTKPRNSPDHGMLPTENHWSSAENYKWWANKGPLPQPSRPTPIKGNDVTVRRHAEVRSEGALRSDDGFVVFKERFDSESTVFTAISSCGAISNQRCTHTDLKTFMPSRTLFVGKSPLFLLQWPNESCEHSEIVSRIVSLMMATTLEI